MASVTLNVPTGTKSWKTTLFGCITALGVYLAANEIGVMQMVGQVLSIVGPVLFGLFAKDANVTGGTVVQESTQAAKAAITDAPSAPDVPVVK
jgi:hypothetical protein